MWSYAFTYKGGENTRITKEKYEEALRKAKEEGRREEKPIKMYKEELDECIDNLKERIRN